MGRRSKPGWSLPGDVPGNVAKRWAGRCEPTGKRIWLTRRDAKQAMRQDHPGDQQMAVYRCQHGEHFHIGHSMWKRDHGTRSGT